MRKFFNSLILQIFLGNIIYFLFKPYNKISKFICNKCSEETSFGFLIMIVLLNFVESRGTDKN